MISVIVSQIPQSELYPIYWDGVVLLAEQLILNFAEYFLI